MDICIDCKVEQTKTILRCGDCDDKLKIKVKKLHKDAVIPQYAKTGDAGLDLTATNIVVNSKYVAYKTGLAFEIPEGYVGLLFPRSSNCNKSLLLSNSVGVLDSG